MTPPDICPVCQEDVPPKAKACPQCGADERSGWNEDALLYDGLDLPDEAWEDDRGPGERNSPHPLPLIWRLAGALALAGMLWWFLRGVL